MGMADIITAELRDSIDWNATYTNGITANFLGGGKLPLTCATTRDAVALALKPFDPEHVRVVRIRDTAHLEELWVSQALLSQIALFPGLEQVGALQPPVFE
jgi:nitrous oxide reductase accessory protein NosL